MTLLGRLLALFVIVPLVELVLLIRLGQWAGLVPTVALVVLTGIVGATLTRREGLRTAWQIRADVQSGRFPAAQLMDGALILLAGGLLLTPGLLTDVLGLSLLVPGSRRWVRRHLATRIRRLVESGRGTLTIRYDEPPPPPGRAL